MLCRNWFSLSDCGHAWWVCVFHVCFAPGLCSSCACMKVPWCSCVVLRLLKGQRGFSPPGAILLFACLATWLHTLNFTVSNYETKSGKFSVYPHCQHFTFIWSTCLQSFVFIVTRSLINVLLLLSLFSSPHLGCQRGEGAGMREQECRNVNGCHLFSISTFSFLLTPQMLSPVIRQHNSI